MGRRGNKKKANNHHNFADNKAGGGGGGNNQKKKPYKNNGKSSQKRRGNKNCRDDPREMKFQLEKIGLALKEINGDGNCLFRALADQLYGDSGDRYHMDLRSNTVDFMRRNREDFEPFFAVGEDGVSFDRHLELLAEDGTFAGNDAIVAFARRYEVTVVIHQLNEPLWKVGEDQASEKKRTRQLHVSYHNGDHYNSVRKIGDLHSNGKAANVCVETAIYENGSTCDRDSYYGYSSSDDGSHHHGDGSDDSDDDQPPHGAQQPDKASLRKLIQEVKDRTGCEDFSRILDTLRLNSYDAESAVRDLAHELAAEAAAKARSVLWSEGGTGQRIVGDGGGGGGGGGGVGDQIKDKKKMTKRKGKRLQQQQGRKGGGGGNDSSDEVVAKNLATLTI